MTSRYILGIDPSLTGTAACVVNMHNIEDFHTSTFKKEGNLRGTERMKKIWDRLYKEFLVPYNVDSGDIFIESFAFGARGRGILDLGGLGWYLRIQMNYYADRYDFYDVPPTVLKKFVTGKGNVNKNVILEQTYKRYGIGSDYLKDDNQVDAYCLARFGIDYLDYKDGKTTRFTKQTIDLFKKFESH